MTNHLPANAIQHIVERPKHLDKMGRGGKGGKYIKISETLKLIDRTKALSYDKNEFFREFGKYGMNSMKTALKKYGIKKPRIVCDDDKIFVWSNDEK